MKRVIAGCIDLTLEFDSVDECNKYANDIKACLLYTSDAADE